MTTTTMMKTATTIIADDAQPTTGNANSAILKSGANSAARIAAAQRRFREHVESGAALDETGRLKGSRQIGREIGVGRDAVTSWTRTFFPDLHAQMRARRRHSGSPRIKLAKVRFAAFVAETGCRDAQGRLRTSPEMGTMFSVKDNTILNWLRTLAPDIHAEMAKRDPRRSIRAAVAAVAPAAA